MKPPPQTNPAPILHNGTMPFSMDRHFANHLKSDGERPVPSISLFTSPFCAPGFSRGRSIIKWQTVSREVSGRRVRSAPRLQSSQSPGPSCIPCSHLSEYNPPLTTPRPAWVTYPRFRRCGASSEGEYADLPHLRLYHCTFSPLFQNSLTFPA